MNDSHHSIRDVEQATFIDAQSMGSILHVDDVEEGDETLSETIIALLGDDYQKLLALRVAIETEPSRAHLVAKSLPEAIALAAKEGPDKNKFVEVLLPLARLLQSRLRKARRRRLYFFWFVLCLVTGSSIWFWQQQVQEKHIHQDMVWQSVQRNFRHEPGYHVTEAWREKGEYRLYGLRDPLARPPESIITSQQMNTLSLQWRWTPMAMKQPAFILARAKDRLDPPEKVGMTWNQGVLTLTGKASLGWIRLLEQRALSLPWVDRVDRTRLVHEETSQEAWQRVSRRIIGQKLYFPQQKDGVSLSRETSARLKQIAQEIAELVAITAVLGRNVRFSLICQVLAAAQDETEAIGKGLDYGEKVLVGLVGFGVNADLFDLESRITRSLSDPKNGVSVTFLVQNN